MSTFPRVDMPCWQTASPALEEASNTNAPTLLVGCPNCPLLRRLSGGGDGDGLARARLPIAPLQLQRDTGAVRVGERHDSLNDAVLGDLSVQGAQRLHRNPADLGLAVNRLLRRRPGAQALLIVDGCRVVEQLGAVLFEDHRILAGVSGNLAAVQQD